MGRPRNRKLASTCLTSILQASFWVSFMNLLRKERTSGATDLHTRTSRRPGWLSTEKLMLAHYLHWAFGAGVNSVRFRAAQGKLRFIYARLHERYAVQVYGQQNRRVRSYGFDGNTTWCADANGSSLRLEPDEARAFISEMCILTNCGSSMSVTAERMATDSDGIRVVRVQVDKGWPIDLWMRSDGQLKAAVIRAKSFNRVLLPLAVAAHADGYLYYSAWKRDSEPPLRIVRHDINKIVTEFDITDPALARRHG
jgi:hypothetical protein